MEPTYIPCVSGKKTSIHTRHLCSPTKTRGLLRASELTLVDCFTFGLKLNKHRINPIEHYRWYIDLANEIQHDKDIVLIAPDFDWLGEAVTLELADKWLSRITAKTMTVVDSYLHKQIQFDNTVGYALTKGCVGPVHPEWTHSFSQHYSPINGHTKLWTYDTTSKVTD
jgi:hypothetical protein